MSEAQNYLKAAAELLPQIESLPNGAEKTELLDEFFSRINAAGQSVRLFESYDKTNTTGHATAKMIPTFVL